MFGAKKRTLSFPNESRSYDAATGRIRFWAYDGAIEISFFVERDAIQKLNRKMPQSEAEFLQAFDAGREHLHEVADRVYTLGPKGSYTCVVSAADF